ncbi:MAG: DUF4390 domain-containing protein [Gemmatimonadetes bacterium]|nr:DUF4390 domain-containing protein [Gemmatimonadota bacterium]
MIRAARLPFVLLFALALLQPGPAPAQSRTPLTVWVGGPSVRWRPEVRMNGVLGDRALRDALHNGLPLRFHCRVELWLKAEPFDQLVGVQEISRALLRAPLGEGYTLEDGRVQRRYSTLQAAERALQGALAPTLHPRTGGRHYYLVRLNVETLSLDELDELRRWLRGEARPSEAGAQPRGVERGVRRILVRLLGLPSRRYEARTPIFRVG